MKALFPLLFILIPFFTSAQKSEKRALIIAIGDYPSGSYWGKISSEKDIPLIKNAISHHGFQEKNIQILQDAAATKAGIIAAVQQLISRSNPGDIVLVHYSGHGQQVFDKNGDELDKRDESIVPVDAPAKYIKGVYEGENHLIDDELELLFGELRMKLGSKGSLTLVFDACHSGTATRGIAPSRGTSLFMGPEEEGAKETVKETATYNFNVKTRGNDKADIAPMVLFSGAGAEELNYETQDEQGNFVGSLSFAFSKVLLNADKNITYKQLFDRLKLEMSVLAPKQSPQIEGDIDYELFGGKGAERQNHFDVSSYIDSKILVLNGGQLLGLYDGSKVAVFPAGTKETKTAKPLSTGTIANSSLIKCDVMLDAPLTENQAKGAIIIITEQKFASLLLKVKIDLADNPDLADILKVEMKDYAHVIRVTDKNPDLVIEANNKFTRGNKLHVITFDEQLIYNRQLGADNSVLAADITKSILAFAQARFLRELETKDPAINVFFEIIPVTKVIETEEGTGRYKKIKIEEVERGDVRDYIKNGMFELKEGDHFRLRITNHGDELAYFTILDIQPDNQINVLIPSRGFPAAEFKIKPGETIELGNIYKIYPPYGLETFKLIASREPMDLSSVVSNKGAGTRGEKASPFTELLKSTYKENTRGAGNADQGESLPPEEVNIFNMVFRIVENK
jgi:hypothetical protein